jgi:hypothetical protein
MGTKYRKYSIDESAPVFLNKFFPKELTDYQDLRS